jgi:hypothetical protein
VTLYVNIDDSKAAICAQLAANLRNIQEINNPANDRLEEQVVAEEHARQCRS